MNKYQTLLNWGKIKRSQRPQPGIVAGNLLEWLKYHKRPEITIDVKQDSIDPASPQVRQ